MKRWHEDFPVAYREWKKHHRFHVERNVERNVLCDEDVCRDIWEVDCPCDTQVGRFRKRDAWDCGKARCFVCHCDKYPKRTETYQEWASQKKLEEGIQELEEMRKFYDKELSTELRTEKAA